MSLPMKRPIHIAIIAQANLAIVDSDGIEEVHLDKIIRNINSLQTLFSYEMVNLPLSLGDYDKLHIYSNRLYFNTMAQRIEASELEYAICIVAEELEDSSFNKHNKEDWIGQRQNRDFAGMPEDDQSKKYGKELGLGVITVEDYKSYTPKGVKLDQYLAYLILCESFCIVSHQHLEHSVRKYCLFDMCHDKKDLITSLRQAYIHDECNEKLIEIGFNEKDINEAYKILAYVRKQNMGYIYLKLLNDPRISVTLGLVLGLSINILTQNYIVLSEILLIGVVVLLAILIFSQMKIVSLQNKNRRRS
jgi:hypothetical protein